MAGIDEIDENKLCPDGYYRGCDFMGCVALTGDPCHTFDNMVPRKGYDYPTTQEVLQGGQIKGDGYNSPIV